MRGRDRSRHARDSRQRPPSRGCSRLATADLVTEETEAPGESRSHRSLHNGAVLLVVGVGDRSLLDDEASLGDDYHESRVEQVTLLTSLKSRAWIPLGAGARVVRLSGKLFEAI
jgi:hypothetical protein